MGDESAERSPLEGRGRRRDATRSKNASRRRPDGTRAGTPKVTDELLEMGILPLGGVLFPGMKVALEVPDRSGQALLENACRHDETFAVVFASQGGRASKIGTLIRVISLDEAAEGTPVATVLATGRCRVEKLTSRRPYLRGKVRLLEEGKGDSDPCRHLAARVAAAYVEYLSALLTLANRGMSEITLPGDPLSLSYAVAASLPLSATEQQQLLEAEVIEDRLRHELLVLERECRQLGQQIRRQRPALVQPGMPSLN